MKQVFPGNDRSSTQDDACARSRPSRPANSVAPALSGSTKVLVNCLLVFVVGLVVAGGGWLYFITTPEYSLREMGAAIKRHDVDAFTNYFDTHSVAAHAVEDLMAEPVRNSTHEGLTERLLGAAAVGWLQPVMVGRLENGMLNMVRSAGQPQVERADKGLLTSIVDALRPPSLSDVLRGLGFSSVTYRGAGSVQRRNGMAYTQLLFERSPGHNTEVEMELKEQQDHHWRVVRFSNLQQVVGEIGGEEVED